MNEKARVENLVKTAMEKRASDIHIEPMEDFIRIRYRIDGELFTAENISKAKQNQIIGRLKAISNMHQEKQESQESHLQQLQYTYQADVECNRQCSPIRES